MASTPVNTARREASPDRVLEEPEPGMSKRVSDALLARPARHTRLPALESDNSDNEEEDALLESRLLADNDTQ